MIKSTSDLKIKIFADGADKAGILEMNEKPYIQGFTTNPTLMKKAGITDYEAFARDVLKDIKDKPISFEVFADEFSEMERQAMQIKSWGDNVYVKIPVTNTKGEPAYKLIEKLSNNGVKLNITAIFTLEQVENVAKAVKDGAESVVSVFAGRVADAGVDPVPHMKKCLEILESAPRAELLWASPREVLNIIQADEVGCKIITVTNDILKKLPGIGKDLGQFSLETVQMFYNDASNAGFKL